ncbi:unnamed protein product [Closterium sp. NIES-65]|nr:unnamed protein product [Closterium sp. NIES-65]
MKRGWNAELSAHVLLTAKFQVLNPIYIAKVLYCRLQISFSLDDDAECVRSKEVVYQRLNGSLVKLHWLFTDNKEFLREKALYPQAIEVVLKDVSATIEIDLLIERFVTYNLANRKRPAFLRASCFHRVLHPVTGADTDVVKGLVQEVLGNPSCDRRKALLDEKEGQLKEYQATRRDRRHLMAGLDAEMSGEISGKQLSRQLKARRSRTQILELNVAGGPVADSKRFLSAASDFFRAIFGADRRTDFSDWSPIPERYLGRAEAGGLEADRTEEEVKAAFKDMAKNKSPGLDGLPKELFENNWDLLGGSFMSLVKDFTATAKLPAETKGAVTILMHKKGEKNQLGNYRPITLLNFTFKIQAKVLADRLKKVLHKVISPEQYDFIPGRKLTDAVALVADIIDAAKNGNKDWHLLLVDFQKAFDSVSRSFIFQVLRKMGLPVRFVGWVEGLHAQTTTRMLINGWLGEGIGVESGVRQGCPLAPYLFLCAVEPLVQEVERKQLGLCDTASGKRLSYLGYADDTTLILEGKQQIKEAEEVLEEFEKKSGLATNKEKSVVLSLGANLGMPSEGSFKWAGPKDAERLLGVWVTPDGSCLPTWEKTLGGVTKKLTGWRQKYLTEKARTTVSNCYISPMIAFQALVYPPPKEIWAETERLLYNFVSGNKATPAKDFVLWSKELLYTPRKGGGLGVQDPNVLLECLSARRVGLLMTEADELKRELMLKAADLPLGLDTFISHDKLLKNWEGRSQSWKQTCEAFMKSPL